MTYDDASWHQDTTEDYGLAESASVTHIVAFFAWANRVGILASGQDRAIAALADRTVSVEEFADTYIDWQIDPLMLTERGNWFAETHYGDFLQSLEGSQLVRGKRSMYDLPSTWDTVDAIAPVLDELYR